MKFSIFCLTLLFLGTFCLVGCKSEPQENLLLTECDTSAVIINNHEIEGYSDKNSYFPGDSIHLYIHSTTNQCEINFMRHGQVDSLFESFAVVPTKIQNYKCRSYSYGCNWKKTFSYKLPDNLPSGIYSAKLSNELAEEFYISFVVKGSGPSTFGVLANTNTWQAYNNWDGHSFYRYPKNEKKDYSEILSFQRPNQDAQPVGNRGHLLEAELHLLRWMEQNAFEYHSFSDRDIHDGLVNLNDYTTLVLNVHPEYWTGQMRQALEGFVNNGGNIINLGANCVYWKTVIVDHQIEKVKSGNEYYLEFGEPGGRWRDLGHPESSLLGVEYDRRGYDTYAPYVVENANHWVFSGTGVVNNEVFGEDCINGDGASGHETDKRTSFSPAGIELLARGLNPEDGGAEMVYFEHTSGAKMFSAGSVTYTGSLSVDQVCHQITKNVFEAFQ